MIADRQRARLENSQRGEHHQIVMQNVPGGMVAGPVLHAPADVGLDRFAGLYSLKTDSRNRPGNGCFG